MAETRRVRVSVLFKCLCAFVWLERFFFSRGTEAPSRRAIRPTAPSSPPPRDEKQKKVQAAGSSKKAAVATASRRSKAEPSKASKSTAKAKGKAKAAAAVVEKEDVDMDEGAADVSEPAEDDDSSEEELEGAGERKAASKSAEAALDRRDEMDVPGWKVGDPVPYAALAKAFALIEATTKRLEKTSLLTGLMLLVIQRSKAGDTDSLLRTVYLCINRVRSPPDVRCALQADAVFLNS